MIAGTLELQMSASLARLADDMHKAKGLVGGAMGSIERSVASAKSALGVLGIGLSAGYFISLIKGSIDAADHLRDLSKTTSLPVEQLAGLRVAAKQSGSDLDGLAASISKLSKNMGNDPAKFAALGVSAKDPLEAFKQLADIFVALEDPQQRAAVMAAALGKSWATAAPLLAEGGQRIGEMVDQGTKLSGVTKEMADQADAFNDKMVLLTGTGGLFNRIITPMLPLLNMLADDMLEAREKTDDLNIGFSPLLETMKALLVLGGNVSYVLKAIGTDLGGMAAQLAALGRGDFSGFSAIRKMLVEDAAKARAEFDTWEKKIMGLSSKSPVTGIKPPPTVDPAAAAAAAAKAKLFIAAESTKQLENLLLDLQKATLSNQAAITSDEKQKAQLRVEAAKVEMEKKLTELERNGISRKKVESEYNKWLASEQAKAAYESRTAMQKLNDDWQNTTKQMQDATANWAKGTTDAILDFVKTGQFNFRKLADSIIDDLIRIGIQKNITGKLFAAMESGGIFESIGKIFGFAHGGEPPVGVPSLVGEQGPELFVPKTAGTIIPNNRMGSVGGNTYYIDARNADAGGLARLERTIIQLNGSIEHRAVAAVSDAQRRNMMPA